MMRLMVAGVVAATITGCGGGGEPKPAPKPTPTVSVETTCARLFLQGHPRLWFHASELVIAQSHRETVDAAEVEAVRDDLTELAGSAGPELRPHIEVMADALGDLDDTAAFQTAATEVGNQCAPYVAGG